MAVAPDFCEPLYDARGMRAVDGWAIDRRGIPSLDLMEHAGAGVARTAEELASDGPVAIVCGKGNNGGDGLVAARLLAEAGRPVRVLLSAPADELSADAAANLARLPAQVVQETARSMPQALDGATVIIDALLGTGFRGSADGDLAVAIDAINRMPVPVLAVDVPSGVDASSGVIDGAAIKASATVTFHAPKAGLWIHPGKGHTGRLRVIDIGVPAGAPSDCELGLIGAGVLERLPHRGSQSTKFTSGHVAILGGSVGLSGAPALGAHACMRAGAGYVTMIVPRALQPVLAATVPLEIMVRGVAEVDGGLSRQSLTQTLELISSAGSVALGPGLGRSGEAAEFACDAARRLELPIVLDADGLNAHAGRLEALAERRVPTVLTPHAGELARLLAISSDEVGQQRLSCVREAAERAAAIVVLKGDDTLIAAPGGPVAVSPGGASALATAGTGDVLAGVVAALLAQRLDPFTAACAAVWIHTQAGLRAARRHGGADGVMASDVIAELAAARNCAGAP